MKPPLKRLGQNFLKEKNILKKIVDIIDINDKNVLEIGPGHGDLTNEIIKKSKKVVVFEIDKYLIEELKNKFQNNLNLEIVEGDFLKHNLSSYKNFVIIANIPYYITTEIIFKIFENKQNFSEIVLMVQKEFANRMCAKVNEKDYGKLSISTSFFYDAKKVFDVNPSSFFPKPKVDSAVIHLKRKEHSIDIEEKQFLKFVNNCFSMKRKTLNNNLKQIIHEPKKFELFCLKEKISLNVRPEDLSLKQYIRLFKFLF